MIMQQIWSRAHGRYQRTVANLFFRRPFKIENSVPYVSFTFDDFPRSALHTGGTILSQFGIRGTFYASLGLMGTMAPTGAIFEREDIKELLEQRHELGCHTFEKQEPAPRLDLQASGRSRFESSHSYSWV